MFYIFSWSRSQENQWRANQKSFRLFKSLLLSKSFHQLKHVIFVIFRSMFWKYFFENSSKMEHHCEVSVDIKKISRERFELFFLFYFIHVFTYLHHCITVKFNQEISKQVFHVIIIMMIIIVNCTQSTHTDEWPWYQNLHNLLVCFTVMFVKSVNVMRMYFIELLMLLLIHVNIILVWVWRCGICEQSVKVVEYDMSIYLVFSNLLTLLARCCLRYILRRYGHVQALSQLSAWL